jgi:hypothetical protein
MTEPWFEPSYAWIPGTVLGCTAGLLGGLAGWLAPRGKAKAFVLGSFWFLLGIAALLLVAGVIAFVTGQPYGVWYGLGLAGLIGVLVLGLNAPVLLHRYRQAEERRMKAHDLT